MEKKCKLYVARCTNPHYARSPLYGCSSKHPLEKFLDQKIEQGWMVSEISKTQTKYIVEADEVICLN